MLQQNLSGQTVVPAPCFDEASRLRAVRSYAVLGRSDLEGLDRMARYVAARFDRSLAAVSLVAEEHVWFGGAFGFTAREVARADSFCDAAIEGADLFCVPDAREDRRLRRHALVRAEGVRSYAGAPVTDADGHILGTVALFGHAPGVPDGVEELAGLARFVACFLAHRRGSGAGPEQARERVQGWLGVRTLGAERYGKGTRPGLIVLSVAPASPAAQAGVRPTDVLHAIDEHVLRRPSDVVAALSLRSTDEVARLRFQRGRRWLESFVPVSERRARLTAAQA